MLNTNFSPWPSFSEEEAHLVANVLRSNKVNYWTGTEGRQFEKEFAAWCDCDYAIALANGTLALDAALKAIDVQQDDEIITTSRTFLATVSSIVTAGATPVFADVELDNQNISAASIQKHISKKTKAIIVVHLAGWPADMDEIMALANQHDIYVIEDCAQAHGAKYKGKPVGAIGHIGAWSFCQDKIMTTGGEGGMVTTNSKVLWEKMWAYKDHGKSWDAIYNREHPPGFRWLHESFGTNWRMTEMQAVLGRYQLTKMADWTSIRNEYLKTIYDTCKNIDGIRLPSSTCSGCDNTCKVNNACVNGAYKCYVFVEQSALNDDWDRDRIMNAIMDSGVPCYSGSCSEVYLEKAFDGTDYRPKNRLANAKELGETSLMFLVHPTLTKQEIELTCSIIKDVMNLATRQK